MISQRLLPKRGGGRVAVVEVMVANARIGDLIRENRPEEIADAIADGDYFGMQTFEQALIAKVLDGSIDRDVAADASSNRHDFIVALERAEKVAALAAEAEQRAVEPEPQPALGGLRVAG